MDISRIEIDMKKPVPARVDEYVRKVGNPFLVRVGDYVADIEAGNINCVIVKDLSRLGRDYIEAGRLIQKTFPAFHVCFIALTDNFDSQTADSNTKSLVLPVKNFINDSYCWDIFQKVKSSQKAKILSEFGFMPRLYNVESIQNYPLVGDDRENEIKRIMHYYIESGIPVAVNVEPRKGEIREGHSLLCIGHSSKSDEERAKKYSIIGRKEKHAVINSADFYTEYCVIDDHQRPYEVRDYRKLSGFGDMWISNLAVPLYKKMYLEAKYAYDIFYKIFRSDKFGLECWNVPKEYLAEDEMVVMRIYQASSRSYKSFKIDSYDDSHIMRKAYFARLNLPQFVWCGEFFSYSEYIKENRQAFATIILDATASLKEDYANAVIAIETVNELITREKTGLHEMIKTSFEKCEALVLIPIYDRNLKRFGSKQENFL